MSPICDFIALSSTQTFCAFLPWSRNVIAKVKYLWRKGGKALVVSRWMRRGAVIVLSLLAAWMQTRAWAEFDHPLRPLSVTPGLNADMLALGRRLFLDPLLSADGTVSCASCHNLSTGGTDRQSHSIGIHGATGPVKAPTIYNSGLNFVQFWDGRAATLEDQVDGPVTNPVEMGANWQDVVVRLKADPSYVRLFKQVFGSDPSHDGVRQAIAAFERSMVTVDSRFDRYLLGDDTALTEFERKGYALFRSYGCASCHQGANVGGNMFQKFGFMGNLFQDRGRINPADLGRFNVTKRESDRYVFKVPSLRLAAINPPYFHDGSVATLPEAIKIMGKYQLGRDIPDGDVQSIAAFLGTLVGRME